MLRKIVIIAAIIVIPLVIFSALRYGKLKAVTFNEAVKKTTITTESDDAPTVLIHGLVLEDATHKTVRQKGTIQFYLRDEMMTDFAVRYAGTDDLQLQHMHALSVAGHVHNGNPPYFHATQIITSY